MSRFPTLDPHELWSRLTPGTTVITVTRRLARRLRAEHDRAQCARGLAVWETPDILPWSAWLQRTWEASLVDGRASPRALLNSAQEQVLWERVIADSADAHALLQVPVTARLAAEAWRRLHEWALPLPAADDPRLNEDARAFLAWAQAFAERCEQGAWLDQARVPDVVAAALRSGRLAPPACMILHGFDELTPMQQDLLTVLEQRGCAVWRVRTEEAPAAAVRTAWPDPESELRAAARWARGLLEQGAGAVGIVVPELEARRGAIARIFDEVLAPTAAMAPAEAATRPYNISAGRPLLDYPVVHSALRIFDWLRGDLPVAQTGDLLRSPYLLGAEQEMSRRALLDARLRSFGEPTVGLADLLNEARAASGEGMAHYACPVLAGALERLRSARQRVPARLAPSAWTRTLQEILSNLGWPGERALDSAEHQTVEAFRKLLAALGGLDGLRPLLSYPALMGQLRRMAAETSFQPEGGEAPVQILGLLEAGGLRFDHLWIAGLHDQAWPPPPRPNPFLPRSLQRLHGLPHATAERELGFARRVTARLLASAPDVVVSHALREGEQELRPSPLIAALPLQAGEAVAPLAHAGLAAHLHASASAERIVDTQGPALGLDEAPRGGTGVFKHQAACPFSAFARYRLGAVALEEPAPGLDPRARGVLLHSALEHFWRETRSHAELCALSEAQVQTRVQTAVQEAIASLGRRRRPTLAGQFGVLEQARLERLLLAWLQREKERPPFTVAAPEQGRRVSVGGIEVDITIDRIDVLDDGTRLVIDYKSAAPSVGAWFGERPDEPQLPLYAVTDTQPVDGVLFAQLRPGDMRFKGLVRRADAVPGIKAYADSRHAQAAHASWEELVAHWQAVLARLGTAFGAGEAQVDPKHYPNTCRHCHLGAVCRITPGGETDEPDLAIEEGQDG